MRDILEFIRDHWNNNTIEIITEYNLDKINDYKESELWELYYETKKGDPD